MIRIGISETQVQSNEVLPGGGISALDVDAWRQTRVLHEVRIIAFVFGKYGQVLPAGVYAQIFDVGRMQLEGIANRDIIQLDEPSRLQVIIRILVSVIDLSVFGKSGLQHITRQRGQIAIIDVHGVEDLIAKPSPEEDTGVKTFVYKAVGPGEIKLGNGVPQDPIIGLTDAG